MSVLFATDFSSRAAAAGDVAARIARQWDEPLVVTHASESDAHDELAREAVRLLHVHDDVRALELEGDVVDSLAIAARMERPNLVVVGATGAAHGSLLGSTASHLSALLPCPILVVRDSRHLVRFLDEGRELKVLATESFDDTFAPARDALLELAKLGPVHALVGHWSFGLRDDEASLAKTRELHGVLVREMKEQLDVVPGGRVDLLVHNGLGRLDVLICDLAREEDVDLIVCGTHQRRRLERVLEGSIASGIVRDAPCSVLVAPKHEARASTSAAIENAVSSPA